MYKLLLTFRYLRRKLIPVFAMLTVVLCTAMVIIVISVMGGFLDLVRNAGRTVMGDVSIAMGLQGFPHYDELIERIEQLPEAEAATPIIVAYGVLNVAGETMPVEVYGVRGAEQQRVTHYREILFWDRPRLEEHPSVGRLFEDADPVEAAVRMEVPWPSVRDEPVLVAGIEINPGNIRMPDGTYQFSRPIVGSRVTLSVLPVTTPGGLIEPSTERFRVVNEFNSGVYEFDNRRVFIPFELAQQMMYMDEAEEVDDSVIPPRVIGTLPARCTEIHIRAAAGVRPEALRDAVAAVYDELARKHEDLPSRWPLTVATWEQRLSGFLRAVENEKALMTVLFGIISLTAVVMIGVTFYMIVLEKTRDIGILRAIGASRGGVASIFLSFGAVLGVIGAGIGTVIAYQFVTHINEIHAWLGEGLGRALFWFGIAQLAALIGGLPVAVRLLLRRRRLTAGVDAVPGLASLLVLLFTWPIGWLLILLLRARTARAEVMGLAAGNLLGLGGAWVALGLNPGLVERLNHHFSIVIWDRSVYFFDRIPSQVNWNEVSVIVAVAILASILGTLIPAIRGALVDPVESLRYE